MTTPLPDKTRNLLLALELIAVTVAGILILIDYKLKRDLLELFARIEAAIETGNRLYSQDTDNANGDSSVPGSFVVGDNPTVETPNVPEQSNGHGSQRAANGQYTTAKRNRGTGNTQIPDVDKPVGP